MGIRRAGVAESGQKSSIGLVRGDSVKRTLVGLGGAVGGVALLRFLRRRGGAPPQPAPHPADALRQKLDESRAVAADREEFEAGETPVAEADPEARRRALHAEARARLDAMSAGDEG